VRYPQGASVQYPQGPVVQQPQVMVQQQPQMMGSSVRFVTHEVANETAKMMASPMGSPMMGYRTPPMAASPTMTMGNSVVAPPMMRTRQPSPTIVRSASSGSFDSSCTGATFEAARARGQSPLRPAMQLGLSGQASPWQGAGLVPPTTSYANATTSYGQASPWQAPPPRQVTRTPRGGMPVPAAPPGQQGQWKWVDDQPSRGGYATGGYQTTSSPQLGMPSSSGGNLIMPSVYMNSQPQLPASSSYVSPIMNGQNFGATYATTNGRSSNARDAFLELQETRDKFLALSLDRVNPREADNIQEPSQGGKLSRRDREEQYANEIGQRDVGNSAREMQQERREEPRQITPRQIQSVWDGSAATLQPGQEEPFDEYEAMLEEERQIARTRSSMLDLSLVEEQNRQEEPTTPPRSPRQQERPKMSPLQLDRVGQDDMTTFDQMPSTQFQQQQMPTSQILPQQGISTVGDIGAWPSIGPVGGSLGAAQWQVAQGPSPGGSLQAGFYDSGGSYDYGGSGSSVPVPMATSTVQVPLLGQLNTGANLRSVSPIGSRTMVGVGAPMMTSGYGSPVYGGGSSMGYGNMNAMATGTLGYGSQQFPQSQMAMRSSGYASQSQLSVGYDMPSTQYGQQQIQMY